MAWTGGEEGFLAQSAEAGELVDGAPAADCAGEVLNGAGVVGEVLDLGAGRTAAFQYGGSVQSIVPAVVAEHLVGDALGSCTFAPDDNTVWVAAEGFDVFLDPAESHPLIEKTGVAGAFGEKLLSLHEAVHVEAVVHGDGYNRLAHVLADFDDPREVVLRVRDGAGVEASSKDPDEDWEGLGVIACGSHDVQVEAVFGHAEVRSILHAAVTLLGCIADVCKGLVKALWPTPSKISHWWLGEGDSQESVLIPGCQVSSLVGSVDGGSDR